MLSRILAGKILVILSLVPLGFLLYTLMSLGELRIAATHSRVIVELCFFLAFLLVGLFLRYYK